MATVMPHGVLFRGGEEGRIRRKLIEHNHSERFWSLVRQVDHNFERKERWPRENGARYSL